MRKHLLKLLLLMFMLASVLPISVIHASSLPFGDDSNIFFYIRNEAGHYLYESKAEGLIFDADAKSFFVVHETDDGKVTIRSQRGAYLSASEDDTVTLEPQIAETVTFELTVNRTAQLDEFTSWFKSSRHKFLNFDHTHNALSLTAQRGGSTQFTLIKAFSFEAYRAALQQAEILAPEEKIVWSFWHTGAERMPDFCKLNVETWKKKLGRSWSIKVLNSIPGHPDNALNFISERDLPRTFASLNPVVQSDSIRIALLARYGGVWMDPSIILMQSLEEICWRDIEAGKLVAGFHGEGWSNDHLSKRDYFENWFIAARKNNCFISRWHQVFKSYWDTKTESVDLANDPLFFKIDISNFQRYGCDFRNYLNQHISFRKVIEEDPLMRSLWKRNILSMDSSGPFKVPTLISWDEREIHQKLILEGDEHLAAELLKAPMLKFTGGMSATIRTLSREQLLQRNHTLGQIYATLLEIE